MSRRFSRARNGNVAMIFALALLPILGLIGGAVDFGVAASNKSAFQDAADAAALAGAKAASAYIVANGSGSAQITQAITLGNSTAQTLFSANTAAVGGGPIGSQTAPSMSATTTVSSGSPTVTMTASSTYKPFLLSILGINSIPMSVTSKTTMSPTNSYYQIVFVVDVSGSMGIGADSSTITAMTNSATITCAFACHDSKNLQGVTASTWCNANPSDYFCQANGRFYCPFGNGNCGANVYSATYSDTRALAARYGYKLKIDYVNSAISTFMTQLSSYSTKYPGRYTVAIDTFGSNADGNGGWFYQLQQPTTNMTVATAASSTIDIEVYPVLWGGYTYTTSGLASALSKITNMGDGSSPTKMLTYVIFLTDAVEDIPNSSAPAGRQTDVSYISQCTAMKNAGVNVFTIWSTYPAIPNDPTRYDLLVKPLASQLPTTLQNCASSPSQYFQANDGPDITTAVNNTFNTIVAASKLRITQ